MSGTSFNGPQAVSIYVAATLKSGIRLYAKTGMKPNRNWTATAMLAKASEITGKKFKRGQFDQAVAALDIWIEENRPGADIQKIG